MAQLRYRNSTTGLWEPLSAANALDDLTDVDVSTVTPLDNEPLAWDNAAGQWVPGGSITTHARGATGVVPVEVAGWTYRTDTGSDPTFHGTVFAVKSTGHPGVEIRVKGGNYQSSWQNDLEIYSVVTANVAGQPDGPQLAAKTNGTGNWYVVSNMSAGSITDRTLLAADLSGIPGVVRNDDAEAGDGGVDIGSVLLGLVSLVREQQARYDTLRGEFDDVVQRLADLG